MGELLCKTWEDRDPSNLVSILFCAQEEDFELYYEELTDQILALRHNVAIYHAKQVSDLDDDTLRIMRLVVAPVTMAFLHPDCLERREIFDRAIHEFHIPVLPILKQRGISRFFGEVCGKIQALDGTGADLTKIPFETKLEQFLDGVLIGDEQIKKIRKAFEARIFLSYRKKDRKHAQKIMHLIHDNPFMRDVAIWYDEYLVPGEQYSDAILDALVNSRMVALLVTPNLVNEDNYVQRVEYPMAREKGKKILPLAAEPTDTALLKKQYEGVGDILTLDQTQEIADRLAEVFRTEGFKENDDPVHLYFVALAYLLGVNVEVDVARGFELMHQAAEAGLDEAAEYYVDCFMEGRYVKKDYQVAREWQEFLIMKFLNEDGEWDWDMYPESPEIRRQVCLNFADRLDKYVQILTACEGITENVLEHERMVIRTLETMASDYPMPRPEGVTGEDRETAELLCQLGDQKLIRMAKEDLYLLLCRCSQKEHDEELERLMGEIWVNYLDCNQILPEYDEMCDMMRMYCRLCQGALDNGWHPLYPKWFLQVYEQWKPFMDAYSEVSDGRLKQASDEEIARRLRNNTAMLYHLEQAENMRMKGFLDMVENTPPKERDVWLSAYEKETGRSFLEDCILDQEPVMEEVSRSLADEDRDTDREELRQDFFRTHGLCALYAGDPETAKRYFLTAYEELKDREDSPDVMHAQIENLKNLILLGRKTDNRHLMYVAYWEIDNLLDQLFYASGDEAAYDRDARENWAQMDAEHFTGPDGEKYEFLPIPDLLAEA